MERIPSMSLSEPGEVGDAGDVDRDGGANAYVPDECVRTRLT